MFMRFRQLHLDFHTSEFVDEVGREFSRQDFQQKLKTGHVNQVTIFARCAHGWSYYDSKVAQKHPGLSFDLLGEMIVAAHEIDVKAHAHISVCLSEKDARLHPEWLIRGLDERTTWVKSLSEAGWHRLCFNNAYIDEIYAQIHEVVSSYDIDGLFLDIASPIPCRCQNCVSTLLEQGKDPLNNAHVWELAEILFKKYSDKVKSIVNALKPGLPTFHNGGHIQRGRPDLVTGDTHFELESLPTGGWGYDHFPLSALYVHHSNKFYSGMTGKFHMEWGEFGSYKHPNALRYEMALTLAYGARCSVGDQLHPNGEMDEATYRLIGEAYQDVAEKEVYLKDLSLVFDVAVISLEAVGAKFQERNLIAKAEKDTLGEEYDEINHISRAEHSDVGAHRLLKEGQYLYTIIDADMDFYKYKVLILPDYVHMNEQLKEKLLDYVNHGGKLLISGASGSGQSSLLSDLGIELEGKLEKNPVYIRPEFELKSFARVAVVVYGDAFKVKRHTGKVLAHFEEPLFNRLPYRFFSHQHAPSRNESTTPAIVATGQATYIAFPIFENYKQHAFVSIKQIFTHCLDELLGEGKTISSNMPSTSIVTVMENREMNFDLIHLVYAPTIKRGEGIEIVEDIPSLHNVTVRFKCEQKPISVSLVPQNEEISFIFAEAGNDVIEWNVSRMDCHQMVKIQY